jgi:arginine decarboxylase
VDARRAVSRRGPGRRIAGLAPERREPGAAVTSDEQPNAPYLEAVVAYAFRGTARYHVPGHKGGPGADPGLRKAIGVDALAADVPQDIHGIDRGRSPTPYERAEDLAADAFGAERSWFLTNGATQGNHALCLALAPLGARVVAQRNSHTSLIDGLVLSGGRPSFVAPEYDAELGMSHAVTPEALEGALREAPDARAAFVVSPTYYGMAADIRALARVAHAAGVPLVVDQSWGPHFGFHDALPPTALSQGADAMVTSTHKIAGALTQGAMLHVGNRADPGGIDLGAVGRAMRLLRSTSPSSLLLASLDSARRQLVLHGEQLLHETLEAIEVARRKLLTIEGIELVDTSVIGRFGVAGYDPLRIVVDVRGTGRTGYEIADALRRSYDVHLEMPTQATIVFVVGLGESASALRRLAGDIEETVKRLSRPGTTAAIIGPPLSEEMTVAPREAFLGVGDVVAVDAAVGRISCEAIASYPPGIPALLPGERISAATVEYLRDLAAGGARLHGASDPRFETITVLREAGGA